MQEYLYTSPLMYEETSKDDIKKFRSNYKYERKADKVLIISIVLFFLSIIVVFMNVPFFYVVSAIILGYIIFRLVKNMNECEADRITSMFDFSIDGEKYWAHIEVHKDKNDEMIPEEEEKLQQ